MDPNPYEAPRTVGLESTAEVPVDVQVFWWTVFNVVALTTMILVALLG